MRVLFFTVPNEIAGGSRQRLGYSNEIFRHKKRAPLPEGASEFRLAIRHRASRRSSWLLMLVLYGSEQLWDKKL